MIQYEIILLQNEQKQSTKQCSLEQLLITKTWGQSNS